MNAEEKLNSLIAEYRLLKTEEEKKGFDEKMRHTLSEISPEERKKFRNAFLISARQTLAKAKELKEEAEIKLLLNGVDNYLSLSQIAQDYFGKSRSWLYQRINGAIVNGKPAQFTPEQSWPFRWPLPHFGFSGFFGSKCRSRHSESISALLYF